MDLDDLRKKASCMVLSQGAEAIIYSTAETGRPTVTKHRFRKRYRHPELDAALTATRLKQEVRSILRARRLGVRAPVVTRVDVVRSLLVMQRIDGKTTKEAFLGGELGEERKHEVARELGRMIATLHDGDLIHGDLTTSNVMIEETTGNVILIDFGLSQLSTLVEDKAVDLYVLERSFRSAHPLDGDELLESLLSSYKTCSKKWCSTMNRLADVRLRGRKRSMVG
jgi:TP53 regulating kinase-like protein